MLALIAARGGGADGRAAAAREMADDPSLWAKVQLSGHPKAALLAI